MSNIRNYSLAVTGDVFRWIVEYGKEEILTRVSLQSCSEGWLAWKNIIWLATNERLDARMWTDFCEDVTGREARVSRKVAEHRL